MSKRTGPDRRIELERGSVSLFYGGRHYVPYLSFWHDDNGEERMTGHIENPRSLRALRDSLTRMLRNARPHPTTPRTASARGKRRKVK